MLRKNLLSVAALALTILINLAIIIVLLNRLHGLSQAQLAERPFQTAVVQLAAHTDNLRLQIQAAFLASADDQLQEVGRIASAESEAATQAMDALRQDTSGIMDQLIPWSDPKEPSAAPSEQPARGLLELVETLRKDLDATARRAIELSQHNILSEKSLFEERMNLAKAARATLSLAAVEAKGYDAMTRGVMAALAGNDQVTLMNVANPSSAKATTSSSRLQQPRWSRRSRSPPSNANSRSSTNKPVPTSPHNSTAVFWLSAVLKSTPPP